jgi:hypothetical protein
MAERLNNAKQLRAEARAMPNEEETRLLLELAALHDQFADDVQGRENANNSPKPLQPSSAPTDRA